MTGRDYEFVEGAGGFLTPRRSTQPPSPHFQGHEGSALDRERLSESSRGRAEEPTAKRIDKVIATVTQCPICHVDLGLTPIETHWEAEHCQAISFRDLPRKKQRVSSAVATVRDARGKRRVVRV